MSIFVDRMNSGEYTPEYQFEIEKKTSDILELGDEKLSGNIKMYERFVELVDSLFDYQIEILWAIMFKEK